MQTDCPWMDSAMDGAPEENLFSLYQAIKWDEEPRCDLSGISFRDKRIRKALGTLLAGATCVLAVLLICRKRNSHE